MLGKGIIQICVPAKKLIGYEITTSLAEDQMSQIVENHKKHVLASIQDSLLHKNSDLYLVQTYPEGEFTEEVKFSTFIGVSASDLKMKLADAEVKQLPASRYFRFKHEGVAAAIDETYVGINEWLTNKGHQLNHPYDFERHVSQGKVIEIYVPLV